MDQVKITVIATGFDEARQRLQQIAGTGPIRPQFVIKRLGEEEEEEKDKVGKVEKVGRVEEEEEERKAEAPEKEEEEGIPPEEDKLDIPAFLRQGR